VGAGQGVQKYQKLCCKLVILEQNGPLTKLWLMSISLTPTLDTVLAGSPKTITDRIQRVLNAAARVVSGMRKFDRGLSKLLHSELHWLDIPQRVQYYYYYYYYYYPASDGMELASKLSPGPCSEY